MAPIDIIILALIVFSFVSALIYAFKRGGECGDCPSHGTCTASIDGKCPVSDTVITRIERGLYDMTGTLGGKSCGMLTVEKDDSDDSNDSVDDADSGTNESRSCSDMLENR